MHFIYYINRLITTKVDSNYYNIYLVTTSLSMTNITCIFISFIYTISSSCFYDSMILGTRIPIPKDKKKSLCNSSNYRAIALSSILNKILYWIILIMEQYSLCSWELQFGFKGCLSTTQCTSSMLEIIDYYNFNKSSENVLMLDASKAVDRVYIVNYLLHC